MSSHSATPNLPALGSHGWDHIPIRIPHTSEFLGALSPVIKEVTWRPVGAKKAVVSVRGQNFFHDSSIAIGDRQVATAADGLRLISDQSLDLTTDVSAFSADAAFLGRYGVATPLEKHSTDKGGLLISAEWSSPLGGFTELMIHPSFQRGKCKYLTAEDLSDSALGQPIIYINGTAVPFPYQYLPSQQDADCLSVVADVTQIDGKDLNGVAVVKFPFRGADLTASARFYNPDKKFALQALTAPRDFLVRKLDGPFVPPDRVGVTTHNWRLVMGTEMVPLSPTCDAIPAATNTFCVLTPNDSFARIIINKDYLCPDQDLPP
jgi:hypothetical protein